MAVTTPSLCTPVLALLTPFLSKPRNDKGNGHSLSSQIPLNLAESDPLPWHGRPRLAKVQAVKCLTFFDIGSPSNCIGVLALINRS